MSPQKTSMLRAESLQSATNGLFHIACNPELESDDKYKEFMQQFSQLLGAVGAFDPKVWTKIQEKTEKWAKF